MPFTSDSPLPAAILEHAIESIGTAVSITDAADGILFVNRYFLELYGYSESDLPSLQITDLRSSRVLPETAGAILPATQSGGWQGILWQKRKDGSEFLIELVTSQIVDQGGAVIALVGVARDITDETRTAARQECLYEIARAVEEQPTLEGFYSAVHTVVAERIEASSFLLVLRDTGSGQVRIAHEVRTESGESLLKESAELAAHVLASGRGVFLAHEDWDRLRAEGSLASQAPAHVVWLGAPLSADGVPFGAVVITNRPPSLPSDEKDLDLLSFIATQISQAILKKRVEDARRFELSFKTALVEAVSDAGEGLLILRDNRVVFANRAAEEMTGYSSSELMQGTSFDDLIHPDERDGLARRSPMSELLATSILRKDGGRLDIQLAIRSFAFEGGTHFLVSFHDITALVKTARTDFLTGLPNRSAMDESIAREWERLKRSRAAGASCALSLLMIEVDHFASGADNGPENGSRSGDELLRRTSRALKSCLRRSDFLGRFGSGEFVALLPDTSAEGARATGERLLRAVDAQPELAAHRMEFSLNIGAATAGDPTGRTRQDLLAESYRALDEAKAAGRNRIAVGSPLPS